MLYDPDYIPQHTDGAEDIFLTVQNERFAYERMKSAGNLANDSGDRSQARAAQIFMQAATQYAAANRMQFGTVYSTLDVIQAAAMLCVYYQDHVKECDKAAA